MGPRWFDGDDPRDDAEATFLDQLRRRASSWNVPGLSPDNTGTLAVLVPLHVSVAVPGLDPATSVRCPRRGLQVGYWQHGHYGHGLEGEWGCEHLLDSHRNDADGLTVVGLDARPEDFADWAADWLYRQLLRPRERQEWLRGGRVVASRTRLADSGLVLFTEGSSLPRLSRRPPDRVITLGKQ